jgi:hypothetical protein
MSLVGVLAFLVLRPFGYKTQKYGPARYIVIGKNWGGVNFGWLFLVDETAVCIKEKYRNEFCFQHELGHGYQNCVFGPFQVILGIISVARYWIDRLIKELDYYGWWFEYQASEIGKKVMKKE